MCAYLSQVLLHDLRAVVDSEDDIGDAGSGQGLDLVQDHGLVAEFDQRLGQGQSLHGEEGGAIVSQTCPSLHAWAGGDALSR